MTNNESKGPFEGLLVIDMTHVLNGPFGTQLLCNMGARVIKVEPPGHGDDTRTFGPYVDGQSLYYSFINHGKESVVLDLKNDHDKSIFINMLKQADVLAENFRPGTMEKLGLSWERLQEINPRLIYASSSGFGHTGPLKDAPAYDTIIQAMSGIMMETGYPDGSASACWYLSCGSMRRCLFIQRNSECTLWPRKEPKRGACRYSDV